MRLGSRELRRAVNHCYLDVDRIFEAAAQQKNRIAQEKADATVGVGSVMSRPTTPVTWGQLFRVT